MAVVAISPSKGKEGLCTSAPFFYHGWSDTEVSSFSGPNNEDERRGTRAKSTVRRGAVKMRSDTSGARM